MPSHLSNNPSPVPAMEQALGDRLRDERLRLGYTQVGLAAALKLAERTVQNYELGRNAIRMSVLEDMGKLGFDIHFLIFGNEPQDAAPVDSAIWERVQEWADRTCRDERGRPLHEYVRAQRMMLAYRWLVGARDPTELETRIARLPPERAA